MLYHERECKNKENANFVHIVYLLAMLCTIFDEAFFIDVSIYTNTHFSQNVHANTYCCYIISNQRTIGPENAHLKPDLGVLSHNEMTLTLNTHTP